MRIRITKKLNERDIPVYTAWRRSWPGWTFVCLTLDFGQKDPIAELRKRVENRLQKEVTVLEYDL